MEFSFNVNTLLKDEITLVDRNHDLFKFAPYVRDTPQKAELREIVNNLGSKSAQAQGLNGAITSTEQMVASDHRCYILKDVSQTRLNGTVIGFLKVGFKKLFFVNLEQHQVEVTPLCVLDFYVHESCQRQGYGYRLFKYMMEKECAVPGALAIDRPSDKMLGFYKKRFNLSAPIKQPNNFVVFRDFFTAYVATSSKRWTDHQNRGPIQLKAVSKPVPRPVTTSRPITTPRPITVDNAINANKDLRLFTKQAIKPAKSAPHVPRPEEFQLPSLFDRPLSSLVAKPISPQPKTDNQTKLTKTPPIKSYNREQTQSFSWSRNNSGLNFNYVVGGTNDSLVQSRYAHFGRPRPF